MTAADILSDHQIIKRFLQLYKLYEGEEKYNLLLAEIQADEDVSEKLDTFLEAHTEELHDLVAFDAFDRATRTD